MNLFNFHQPIKYNCRFTRAAARMSLSDWFRDFCKNISVQSTGSISDRKKLITKRINRDFWNTESDSSHSFYAGSFGRGTAVKTTSDVDIVVQLPSSEYHKYDKYESNGQSALLQSVKRSISKTYPTTSMGGDGQVIQIDFTDGLKFEIVPAFLNTTGTYNYADTNGGGSWKTMDPKSEISAMRTRNSACNGNLIPLCRMMRSWKTKKSVPISGLLIDTLAYQFINTWANRDKSYLYYDFMIRDFLDYLAIQDTAKEFWKAPGSGRWVYGPKGQFQYKARVACNLAKEAIAHETASPKREFSAKNKWRDIFGTSFPS